MPIIPIALLLAWQALARTAAFALGWATALFFGQIPGNKGRVLSVVALTGAAWVILLVGGALPLGVLALAAWLAGDALSWPGIEAWVVIAVLAGVVVLPPLLSAFVEFTGFDDERSVGRWLRRLPISYPIAGSIGLAVVQMGIFTPVLALRRKREGRTILQVPLVVGREGGLEDLGSRLERLLERLGRPPRREDAKGPMSWPLQTLRYAARELLGSAVTGRPLRLVAGNVELIIHSTDVTIVAPPEIAYRLRAAIERDLAFSDAFLTWSDDSQRLEAELRELQKDRDGDLAALVARLDEFQERVDSASLKSDEWNILYRLRLQVERQARINRLEELERSGGGPAGRGAAGDADGAQPADEGSMGSAPGTAAAPERVEQGA